MVATYITVSSDDSWHRHNNIYSEVVVATYLPGIESLEPTKESRDLFFLPGDMTERTR